MAQFRGSLRGARGETTRLGNQQSGLRVEAQSWQGKIVTVLYHDDDTGVDMADVNLERHHGEGTFFNLYHGPVSGTLPYSLAGDYFKFYDVLRYEGE